MTMGRLYVVDALAGHWEDVTLRAIRILREVSLIVTEDPERAGKLLRKCDVHIPLRDLDLANEPGAILDALREGDVAWLWTEVTELAESTWGAREAPLQALLERGVGVVPVPGPTAPITGLLASGLPASRFTFLGLLPGCQHARRSLLKAVAREPLTLVCDVWTCHLSDALQDVQQVLGDRRVAIRLDRHTWRGKASEAPASSGRGRCTLVVQGAEQSLAWTEQRVREQVREMLAMGKSPRDVARDVALRSGWPKRKIYAMSRLVARDMT